MRLQCDVTHAAAAAAAAAAAGHQALNAAKMKDVLAEADGMRGNRLVIPQPIMELTTR
jgi:hypothetical protein